MALALYNKKRNFKATAEPEGKAEKKAGFRFVVQRHDASHLHYDFRLELGGVLKSWAVPKGPSLDPKDKRLAMMVEDHPVSYIHFEGKIPEGNYGAGDVIVWDKGTFVPVDEKHNPITEKQALSNIHKGEMKFVLKGRKLKGEFVLVHLKSDTKKDNSWLLIKHKDDYAEESYNSEEHTPAAALKASEKKKNKGVNRQKKINSVEIKETGVVKKLDTWYQPMLATLIDKPFDDKAWIYEIKWDGYRAVADWQKKKLQLYSRNGLSFIKKYPVIAEAVKTINADVVLDGEIVLLDEDGKPSFQKLQSYEDNMHLPLVYYVFDLLFLNKKDIRNLPLLQRKELLKEVLDNNPHELIHYCDHIEEHGIEFFNLARKQHLEGIIAKRADSEYLCGARTKEWLKIKNINTREAIIAGYTQPRNSRKYFGALVLAEYNNDKLQYIGHTGTGFNEKTLKGLWGKMQPLVTNKSPFDRKVKVNMPVTWIKPKLVCALAFTEVTSDGMLRHPVYEGLRIDKNITDVKKQNEQAVPVKKVRAKKGETTIVADESQAEKNNNGGDKTITVDKHTLQLTNLDKIYWPDDGYTKGDLIEYYQAIAKYILPYIKNRPMSLKRNPNGIADDGFFQKDAGGHAPEWIKQVEVYSDSTEKIIHYIMLNDTASLLYAANLGCIEMNPWNSAMPKIDNPTYMVIDIDPSDKNTFDEVIETAQAVKVVLDKAGAPGYCKTSGATGLHVYIPMAAKYSYDQVKNFGHLVATLVQQMLPGTTSLERSLAKRGPKIYVDFLQNRKGQTLSCAYSVRPKPGATVSTPLEWGEVKPGLHPSNFTIKNIHERLDKKGDLFLPVLGKGIDLARCLKKLEV